jgi:hypothetical protein
MRLKTGIDEEMNPIYRNRSFRIVKHTATHEDLFELAEEIAILQICPPAKVRCADASELEEE